jgi:hypothetical protein
MGKVAKLVLCAVVGDTLGTNLKRYRTSTHFRSYLKPEARFVEKNEKSPVMRQDHGSSFYTQPGPNLVKCLLYVNLTHTFIFA